MFFNSSALKPTQYFSILLFQKIKISVLTEIKNIDPFYKGMKKDYL